MLSEEHGVTFTEDGFDSLTASLSWVVQTVDVELENEGDVVINIHQYSYMDTEVEDDGWHKRWEATVSGNPKDT